ncbi:tenascin-N-like isoform X1 [Oncorhynchus clarkii lewisi]|uniref:tenascin-N-like isoform X1 n=1 Tax=Oncorhynchus clarkii lewisi TaxID=490388 RepID=UPI0039B9184D
MTTRLHWLSRALCLIGILCTVTTTYVTEDSPAPAEKGVTFSHIYKIDLTKSPGCKLALQTMPHQQDQGLGLQELEGGPTLEGDKDIVFRHQINLKTSKCDCDESERFKSLLYRVIGLEEEVEHLKSQCSQGFCGGKGGGAGGVDTSCSGHGTYQHDTCSCQCNPGWEGPDCSISTCPDECNDHGRCVDGKCVCLAGYMGSDCSQLMCPGDCNDKGYCVDGKCVCFSHFTGEDCSEQKCSPDCVHGTCVNGMCICDEGFFGDDCSAVFGPNGLRLVRVTDVSLLVEWQAVRAAEYYVLTWYPEGNEAELEQVTVPNTETSYLITGLRPGVTYVVQVYAVIKEIQSEGDRIEATTVVSGIDGIRVLGQTEDSIQVDWQNPAAPLDHFRLTHANPDGQEEEQIVPMSAEARTTNTIVGLQPGTEYLITVQGIKGTIEGKASFVTGVTDLDAPTNLLTKEVTEDTATVEWQKVQAEIDGYVISYSSAEGSSGEITVGADSSSYRLTGLRPGVIYTVYIWAVKGSRVSRKSSTEAETDLDAPANLLTREVTEDTTTVTWEKVQAEIDSYVISYTSAEGSSGEIHVGADSSSYRLTGLRPGVIYTVYIWAVKGSRVSRKSSTVAETDLDAPTNLLTREVTEDTADVSWDRPLADIDGYMISYSSAEGSSGEIPVGADSSSYRLTGLRPGVIYTVYIWAVKGSRVSRKSSTVAETDLDAPTNLLTREVTEDTADVSWDRPLADIDGYVISYSSAEGSSGEIPVGADSSSYRLTGLRPGVIYTVYIWAVKGSRVSRKSSTVAETDLDAPTNLLTREVAEDTADVSWDRPLADIDGYMISYSSAEGSSGEIPVGADSSSYRLTGLRPGVIYTVYIWAVKGSRVSRKSSTVAETDLDAPTNLLTREVTEDTADVSWDRPLADIDGYVISYSSAEGSSGEIPVGADSSSYRLTGLRPGVIYTVYIWAVKGSRVSRKSSTVAETDLDAPTNLLTREVTEDTADVSWDRPLADIDGYMISYSSAEGSSGEIPVGADSSSYRLTGLRPGVIYTVYIWAVKGSRVSRKSSTPAETEIDSPKNLKASDVKLDAATLTWTAPLARIDGYILTFRAEDGTLKTLEKKLREGESRFAMSGLEMGKNYIVTLLAYRGAKRSRVIETTFKTVGLLYPFPMDCTQIKTNGNMASGIYTIYINSDRTKPMEVYCDMDTDGGGWVVLQRRNNGQMDFMKRWRPYMAGFGNMTDEFWLGLDNIYELTNTPTQYELRVDLGVGSEKAYAVYDNFKIAPAKQKFKLTIGKYRGTAGDAMNYHQGRPFSTVDNDNDIALGNCALTHRGAWWYKNCHLANLNGKFGDNRHSMGVNWEPWKGHLMSLDFTEMKIRPVGAARKRRSLSSRTAPRK